MRELSLFSGAGGVSIGLLDDGTYVTNFTNLYSQSRLKATTLDEAKHEAIVLARSRLAEMIFAIDKLQHVVKPEINGGV